MPRTNYPNIPKSRSSNEIQGTIFHIKWNIYFEDHKNLLSSKQVLFDFKAWERLYTNGQCYSQSILYATYPNTIEVILFKKKKLNFILHLLVNIYYRLPK